MLYSLFHNDVLRLGAAFLSALVVSLVFGAWLIRFFHEKNVIEDTTQPDHAGLNTIQSQKKNVPTMGGLMILAAMIVSALLWTDLRSPYVWIGLLVLAVLGGAGFVDDYIKLKRKPSRGLTKTQKLIIQFVLGGVVAYLLIDQADPRRGPSVMHVFAFLRGHSWDIGWWYLLWSGIVIAATSNAVNLTDGLDGLAGGLALIAAGTLALVSTYLSGWHDHGQTDGAVLCTIAAGGLAGFLVYNRHPAKIFMGDTGSLAVGGLLAYVALILKVEFLLLVIGAVFFIEELTVAMQIASFKLTAKRIFPITPIHHYFQVNLKWPEQRIVTLAWLLGGLCAFVTFMMVRN